LVWENRVLANLTRFDCFGKKVDGSTLNSKGGGKKYGEEGMCEVFYS